MRQRSREQLIGASLALLVTAIIVIEFVVDTKMGLDPGPQITYVDLYSSNRLAAEKEKQRQFQKLEKQLGIE